MGDIVKLSGEEKEEIVLTRSSVLISYIISWNLFVSRSGSVHVVLDYNLWHLNVYCSDCAYNAMVTGL